MLHLPLTLILLGTAILMVLFAPLIGDLVPSVIAACRAAAVESGEPEEKPAEDLIV